MPSQRFSPLGRARCGFVLLGLACVLGTDGARVQAADDAKHDAFEFSSPLRLPLNVSQLAEFCPSAKKSEDKRAGKEGLTCYIGTGFKGADEARFYYVGDLLYQVELAYKPERVAALGGLSQMIAKMVGFFGPAEIVDMQRRAWTLNSLTHVDFYQAMEPPLLVITQTMLEPLVEGRR